MLRWSLCVASLSAVVSARSSAQELLQGAVGSTSDAAVGWTVCGPGDVNGDGLADFVATSWPTANFPFAPFAAAYSGKTGALIHKIQPSLGTPPVGGADFNASPAHDVDADGFADLLIGRKGLGPNPDLLFVASGKTGASIRDWNGAGFWRGVSAGDFNGDGTPDVVANGINALTVFSGKTGAAIALLPNYTSARALHDVNGDGIGDLLATDAAGAHVVLGPIGTVLRSHVGLTGLGLVGDADYDGADDYFGTDASGTHVFAGRTGSEIATLAAMNVFAPVGDLDIDGRPDLANLQTIVSTEGANVAAVPPTPGTTQFAPTMSIAGAGDGDGDGFPDIVLGVPAAFSFGAVYLYSMLPWGTGTFGSGTHGCSGPHRLRATAVPSSGNAQFGFRADHAPPSSTGFVIVSAKATPSGSGVPLGIELLVNVSETTVLATPNLVADPYGYAHAPLPLPAGLPIGGQRLFAQALWVWTSVCSPSPLSLSTSAAVDFDLKR